MKLRVLFNLLEDASEIANLFAKVETPEQMVSFLERLKRQGSKEFLDSITNLRLSVEAAYEDSLEMGGNLTEDDDLGSLAEGDGEDLLAGLGDDDGEVSAEESTTENPSPTESKSDDGS